SCASPARWRAAPPDRHRLSAKSASALVTFPRKDTLIRKIGSVRLGCSSAEMVTAFWMFGRYQSAPLFITRFLKIWILRLFPSKLYLRCDSPTQLPSAPLDSAALREHSGKKKYRIEPI